MDTLRLAAVVSAVMVLVAAYPAQAYLEWLTTGFSITYRVISFVGGRTRILYYSVRVTDRIVSTNGYKYRLSVKLDMINTSRSAEIYVDMYGVYMYLPIPDDPFFKDVVEREGRITISMPVAIPGITSPEEEQVYSYGSATFHIIQKVDYSIGEVSAVIRRAYECTGFFHGYSAKAYIDSETGLLLELLLFRVSTSNNATLMAHVSIFELTGLSSNTGGEGKGPQFSATTGIAVAMAVVGSFFILIVYLILRKVASIYHAAMEAGS